MTSGIITSCFGPPDQIRKWNSLGLCLDVDFKTAKVEGRLIKKPKGIATETFKSYLEVAMGEKNIVDAGGLPFIVGDGGWICDGIGREIEYGEMSVIINTYLLRKPNVNARNFYDTHSPFIKSCWKTARNVLLAPCVRSPFEGDAEIYEDFIKFLRKEADNSDNGIYWI